MEFRKARKTEQQRICTLYKSMLGTPFCAWDEEYPGMGEITRDLETGNLYVLADEDRILGTLSVMPERELDDQPCWNCADGRHREIARICVAKEARGRGLAGYMVAAISDRLRQEGCSAIHLSAAKQNLPALRTYEKQGFAVAGEAPLYGGTYCLLERIL